MGMMPPSNMLKVYMPQKPLKQNRNQIITTPILHTTVMLKTIK